MSARLPRCAAVASREAGAVNAMKEIKMASNKMYYEIEDERACNRARARAHQRVYVAQLGSAATDQSDLDIAALIQKLHRWTAELRAELDKRAAFQEHMDEVSAGMEAADLEQQEQT